MAFLTFSKMTEAMEAEIPQSIAFCLIPKPKTYP